MVSDLFLPFKPKLVCSTQVPASGSLVMTFNVVMSKHLCVEMQAILLEIPFLHITVHGLY